MFAKNFVIHFVVKCHKSLQHSQESQRSIIWYNIGSNGLIVKKHESILSPPLMVTKHMLYEVQDIVK